MINRLANSRLPKGVVVKDVLLADQKKLIDRSISLPKRTIECYYEQVIEGRFQSDKDINFNEILPLLYLSLSYQHKAYKDIKDISDKDHDDPFIFMSTIDDLIIQDPEHSILDPHLSHRTIEFLTRLYIQDGAGYKKYQPHQAYWLTYLENMSQMQHTPRLMRRCEALKSALMIDRGKSKDAKQVLEMLVQDYKESSEEEAE